MPPGPERSLSLRIPHLGLRFKFIGTLAMPFLVRSAGWQGVAYSFAAISAVFGLLWQCVARNTPAQWLRAGLRPRMSAAEQELLGLPEPPADAAAPAGRARFPGYLFTLREAYFPVLTHISVLAVDYGMMQWAPTRYLEDLACSPGAAALHISAPAAVDFVAQLATSALEKHVLERGHATKAQCHRFNVMFGSAAQALGLCVFGLTRTAWVATVAACVVSFFKNLVTSFMWQNYMEVGGEDAGVLKALGNMAGNTPGIFLPPLGVFVRSRSSNPATFWLVLPPPRTSLVMHRPLTALNAAAAADPQILAVMHSCTAAISGLGFSRRNGKELHEEMRAKLQ
jgi:hypothetical protein